MCTTTRSGPFYDYIKRSFTCQKKYELSVRDVEDCVQQVYEEHFEHVNNLETL